MIGLGADTGGLEGILPSLLPTGALSAIAGAFLVAVYGWRRWRGGQVNDFTTLLAEHARTIDRKDAELMAMQAAGAAERARLEAEIATLRASRDAERQKAEALYDLAETRRQLLVEHGWEAGA